MSKQGTAIEVNCIKGATKTDGINLWQLIELLVGLRLRNHIWNFYRNAL